MGVEWPGRDADLPPPSLSHGYYTSKPKPTLPSTPTRVHGVASTTIPIGISDILYKVFCLFYHAIQAG